MTDLYPQVEPHRSGHLDVGGGHEIYWEECGNPAGIPALVLHGGPGSGCTPGPRRLFDPGRYRTVLFDQRGCGRSRPRVSAFTDLSDNTTGDLLDDIERLRTTLKVERWVVHGLSWGSTLALAYAEAHPDRVAAMVLASVTMTRPNEIHWLYHEAGRFYPEAWRRFRDGAGGPGGGGRGSDLVEAYWHLLHEHPETTRRERAARDWCAWEAAASPLPGGGPNPRYRDPDFRMTFARLVTHYFHHRAWLSDGQLLDGAVRLAGIPGVLVHGRQDLGSPLDTAWELAQAWPGSELVLVSTGHAGGKAMTAAVVDALDRWASATSW